MQKTKQTLLSCIVLTALLAAPAQCQSNKARPPGKLGLQLYGDKAAKIKAMSSLAKVGPGAVDALPDLLFLLKDPDTKIQTRAAVCILSIEPDQNAAIKTLTNLMRHRDQTVRIEAIQAAGDAKIGALTILPELIISLQGDISPKVRDRSAWAIGQFGAKAKEAIPTILDALKKNHPLENFNGGRELNGLDDTIYKTCVATLGQIGYGSSAACNVLASILVDHDKVSLQEPALKALYKIGPGAASVVPVIAQQMANLQTSRKIALIKLLKRIGPTAGSSLPQLQECMKSEDPMVRRTALDAMLTINPNEKEKQELLASSVNDTDQALKSAASEALASSTAISPESLKALIENAEHGTAEVRVSSMKTIGNYGALAINALPVLVKTYISTTVIPAQRKEAFETIKKLDPTGVQTIPLLQTDLNDPFRSRSAIELLEFIGTPRCNKLVVEKKNQWHMGRTIK